MDTFEIMVGCATILACVISIISLIISHDCKKKVKKFTSSQSVKDSTIKNSTVTQAGRDIGGGKK